MVIQRLRLANFRAFRDFSLDFSEGLNLIAGINGAGKTTILDAIELGMTHMVSRLKSESSTGKSMTDADIRNGCHSARVDLFFCDEGEQFSELTLCATRTGVEREAESNYKDVSAWARKYRIKRANREEVSYPILAHYKVNRAVLAIPKREKLSHPEDPLSGYDKALTGGGDFRQFFAWFRDQEDYENEQRREQDDKCYQDASLQAVRSALEKFLPELKRIRVRRHPQAMIANKGNSVVEISQLSDGEKCYLALIGDIACRLARLASGLKLTSDQILNGQGIVLIDELDLHLHPQWQRQSIRLLPKVFPKIQFIVTTHSPQMIGEVEPERVTLLQGKSGNAVRPENTIGLSSGEVLSLLMETTERNEETETLIRRFRALLDKEDYTAAKGVLSELAKSVGNASTLPVLNELSTELFFLNEEYND